MTWRALAPPSILTLPSTPFPSVRRVRFRVADGRGVDSAKPFFKPSGPPGTIAGPAIVTATCFGTPAADASCLNARQFSRGGANPRWRHDDLYKSGCHVIDQA